MGRGDKTGAWAIPAQFENGWHFNQGLAAAQTNGKWGFIDTTGKFVIQPQYDDAGDFSEDGTADVSLGGVEITIDKTGKQVQ